MSRQIPVLVNKTSAFVVGCVGFLAAGLLFGQQQRTPAPPASKAPQVTSVFPAGAQRGGSAEIEVKGKNLAGVTDLEFSAAGLKVEKLEAKGADRLLATVAVEQDAQPGILELRALSREGVSNLRLFRIDELPQLNETIERNDDAAHAQKLDFPVVVNGQLGAADIDCYSITVKEKQRVVFEVEARRLGSPADARLRLLDAHGRIVKEAAAARSIRPDERIDFEFATPGDYVVAVEDAEYVGGDGAVYRLRIGTYPYATSMFPLGGRRGESVELTLEGGNLSQAVVQTVTVPDQPHAGPIQLRFATEQGTLFAPMSFAVADEPALAEKEPNDEPAKAQPVQAPVVVDGRIGQPGDKDRFLLKAKRNEKFVIEVQAERLGSWLDSFLVIADKSGRNIAENDDLGATPNQQRQPQQQVRRPRASSDSRLEFTAPADGEFVITLDDRTFAGGPEYGYRLSVAPLRPDFALFVGPPPNAPQQQAQRNAPPAATTDALNLEPGKSATVPIAVERRGYDGEIELTARGLPDGVTADAAKIAAKQAAGQLTIKAAADANGRLGRAQIVGRAKINDQEVERIVRNEIVIASLDPTHVARRDLSEFVLAVANREQPLAVKVDGEPVLARGMETELKIAVERKAGFKGPVEIKLDKLPKGVSAAKATIAEDKSEGVVKLTAAADAALGQQKLQLVTQGKSGNATVEASTEVALAVVMPFELTLDTKEKEIELVIGESCSLKLAVKRRGTFDGPIELAVNGLPAGVTATPDKIEPDADEVELTLAVGDEAKPNKNKKPIKIQATGTIGKQKIKVETAAINVTVKQAD